MATTNPSRPVTQAEAAAWADTLVRAGLLHAAVLVPTGQWLIHELHDAPVQLLSGPRAVIALVACIQRKGHRSR